MDTVGILRALDEMLDEYLEGAEPVSVVMGTRMFWELYGPSTGKMVMLHKPYGDVHVVGDSLCPEGQMYCCGADGWERYNRQRDAWGKWLRRKQLRKTG